MNSLEKKIKSFLVRTVPLPADMARDWEDVVRRSGASGQTDTSVRRSKRSYLARRLVPAFALAAAIIAVGLIAPWQHGPGSPVMGRALAAIEDKPVIHVVFRDQIRDSGGYVELATGQLTPILDTSEIWYDRERGFQHEKLIVEASGVFPTKVVFDILKTPEKTWTATQEDYPGGQPNPPLWMTGFFDNYQSALESGTAHVAGTATVDGHDVSWIEWANVSIDECPFGGVSGPGISPSGCTERVAVDEASSLPLRVEWLREGNLMGVIEIASIETLPTGSGDFSKPEKRKLQKSSARALSLTLVWGPNTKQTSNMSAPDLQVASTDLPGAVKTLPGAFWAGKSIASLPLSGVSRATARSFDQEGKPAVQTGVELHYGDGQATALWSETSSDNELTGNGVVIHEQKASTDWMFWPDAWAYDTPDSAPPAGLMRMDDHRGWLKKGGFYVLIVAPNHDLLLEVARALEPIKNQRGRG